MANAKTPEEEKKARDGILRMLKAMQGAGQITEDEAKSWVKSVNKGYNDFIWRPGQKPIKFSKDDILVGAKDGISLKEGKDIHLGIQRLETVMEKVNEGIDSLINITKQTVTMSAKSGQKREGLDGIPASAGYSREPAGDKAYGFRTRAWEILHGVA